MAHAANRVKDRDLGRVPTAMIAADATELAISSGTLARTAET
jgi:hypothetical protein